MNSKDEIDTAMSVVGKRTWVTRTISDELDLRMCPPLRPPRSGDVVVARVVAIGAHACAEDRYGRRMRLYPGDLLVGAYGNRYATDFYEGYVPELGESVVHLLTAGGLVGRVASAHDAHLTPTELEIVGCLAGRDGSVASLEDFARSFEAFEMDVRVPTTLVVGTSMNAGKTTTAAAIIRGLSQAGIRVGAGKVTGSGSGKDRWAYADAGAHAIVDFLDFGMPSTFGYPLERLAQTMRAIHTAVIADGAEAVVLEIADGLLQQETRWLLEQQPVDADAIVFAATDALSAQSGVEILRGLDLPVRAISGLVSRSPLAARETEAATGLPVLRPAALAAGAAVELLARIEAGV
jgi:molybdopterin-guanine dinucleotide biosynthesis protein